MKKRSVPVSRFLLAITPVLLGILSCGVSVSYLGDASPNSAIPAAPVIVETRMVTRIISPTDPPSIPFAVFAGRGWQNSEAWVRSGERVTIRYESGTWSGGIGRGKWYDGRGDLAAKYRCVENYEPNQCDEPMPNVYNGTLVAKIGSSIFEIGNYLQFVAGEQGDIYLRMNDHDEGLFDNDGFLIVEIVIMANP